MKRLVLLLALIYPLARFCHHQTKGFRLSKFTENGSCLQEPLSEPMPDELKAACNQPFTYLGRGLQSFSFISEDGKMVLKLFNNRHRRHLFWLNLPGVKQLTKKRIDQLQKKWNKTFTSYQIASKTLREETALLYYQPKKRRGLPNVTLIDPLGSPHHISLSNYAFALQKKAQSSFAFFLECEESGALNRAKEGLESLVELMKKKANLKIHDDDPLIRTNIGFIDGKAMQIDLGPFSKDPSVKEPVHQGEEMKQILVGLRTFIQGHTPSLLPLIDQEISHL